MATLDTEHISWLTLNQASVTLAAGLTADVNTYVLKYLSTAFTTLITSSGGAAAHNPVNVPSLHVPVPQEANGIRMLFLVADTNNDEVAGTLWIWAGNGPAKDAIILNPIRAGNSPACTVHPVTGAVLTNFRYADIITATTNNSNAEVIANTPDGIGEVRIDLVGDEKLFFDFDCNAGAGTAGTDCIIIYKWY